MSPETAHEVSWVLITAAFVVGVLCAVVLTLAVQWGEIPIVRAWIGGEWWRVATPGRPRARWTNDHTVLPTARVYAREDYR